MDQSNFDNVIKLARNTNDIAKVKLILEVNAHLSDKRVPDPYYGDVSDFEHVFYLLDTTCSILSKTLMNRLQ